MQGDVWWGGKNRKCIPSCCCTNCTFTFPFVQRHRLTYIPQHHKHHKLCTVASPGFYYTHLLESLQLQPLTPRSPLLWKIRTLCRSHWTIRIITGLLMAPPAARQVSEASQRPNGSKAVGITNWFFGNCVRVRPPTRRTDALNTHSYFDKVEKHNWYHSCWVVKLFLLIGTEKNISTSTGQILFSHSPQSLMLTFWFVPLADKEVSLFVNRHGHIHAPQRTIKLTCSLTNISK